MDVTYLFETSRQPTANYTSTTDVLNVLVDYGDKNEGAVFDHHASGGGDCSTTLVCSNEGVSRLKHLFSTGQYSSVRIVTHSSPDLDSVGAAAVITRFAKGISAPLSSVLVEYIRRHDQGELVSGDPTQSLSMLFQTIKNRCSTDSDIMVRGILLVEAVDQAIRGAGFHLGWNDLADLPQVRELFASEASLMASEIRRVQSLLAQAPRALLSLPQDKNGSPVFRWAEALILDFAGQSDQPIGWKEVVRSEGRLTMFGEPFPFTAVRSLKRGRDNYIFSVSAGSGLSLKGLGAYLEAIESQMSSELQEKPDAWSPRIRSIAEERSGSNTPCLLRAEARPRPGYSNSDPWYDGRGHNYTIVDTPESGTVLEPAEVLLAILKRYSPLWREHLLAEDAVCDAFDLNTAKTTRLSLPDWLQRSLPQWGQDDAPPSRALADSPWSVADAISSARSLEPTARRFALYLPVAPTSSRTLPQDSPNLHVLLAQYLMAHRLPALCASPPPIHTIKEWAARFVSQSTPGAWWAVSDSFGIVILDYLPSSASHDAFREIAGYYFALMKQLTWTDTLSRATRQKKRYDAVVDFVDRQRMG